MVGQTVIWTFTSDDSRLQGEIESWAATEEEAYMTGYVHWLLMLSVCGVGDMPTLVRRRPWRDQ